MEPTNTTHSTKAISKPEIVFVLGAPGAGKGTLCKKLAERLGYYHLSVGDYLRELRDAGEETPAAAFGGLAAAQLRADLKERKLIPPACMFAILKYKIDQERSKHGEIKVLVDGFPRQVDGARLFEAAIAAPSVAVLIECERSQAEARFLARAREDDGPTVFAKRYDEYLINNEPIVGRYESKLRKVDNGGSIGAAFEKLLELLET